MNRKRIAIYGKGGIGKTTLSVNLALSLAASGKRVLLVGCDPKRDTARLLLSESIPTIVDNYEAIVAGTLDASKVCIQARDRLWCCETGGPKPGIGCAGRGVLIALDLLEKNGLLKMADVVLYDVLGDVVCGGFATPVTRGFTDRVYVVTSGEQASLLAANNILSGMTSIGGNIGGLIFNARGFEGEYEYIEAFANRVRVDIIARMPYSQKIKLEELDRRAICETQNAETERNAIRLLAQAVLSDAPAVQPEVLEQELLYEMIAQIGRRQRNG